MRRRLLLVSPVLFAASLIPASLAGQLSPLSGVFPVPLPSFFRTSAVDRQQSPAAVPLAGGGFAVLWAASGDGSDPAVPEHEVVGRLLTADGQPARGFFVGGSREEALLRPVLSPDGSGGFVSAWSKQDGDGLWVRRFGARARPQAPAAPLGDLSSRAPAVAANAAGAYVLAWLEAGSAEGQTTVVAQSFTRTGSPLGPEIRLGDFEPGGISAIPAAGMDAHGRFAVAWIEPGPVGGPPVLWAQRFARDSAPLAPRFAIGAAGGWGLALFMDTDGGISVAWEGLSEDAAPARPLLLRRYDTDGSPLGPPVEAGTVRGFEAPVIGADRRGNFALAWLEGSTLVARLFNRSLVMQNGSLRIRSARHASGTGQDSPGVALADDGRLLAVWAGPGEAPIQGRLWRTRRDAELCAYREGFFLCDTANDGGAADEAITFGFPGDIPLLGDFDGDGRDDPCVYRNGRFLCDIRHDGGAAELRSRFEVRRGVPLLGDLDGDGRDDPCLKSGSRLLCDLSRDGIADLDLRFGASTDAAFLADLDGDGRDDPCVYRKGRFLCDTLHDGFPADRVIDLEAFLPDEPEGQPLLGDMNGDGRAEACLLTEMRLACWILPVEGGDPVASPETVLHFGGRDTLPLVGNLDGF